MSFCNLKWEQFVKESMEKPVGLTKDVGYQFGLRKVFLQTHDAMWDLLFSKKGLAIWLGDLKTGLAEGEPYRTTDGIEGLVRVFKPCSHIRMNWKKPDWDNLSTLQVRVIESNGKSIVSFHHEKLRDASQREEVKKYWNEKMNKLALAFG